MKSPTLFSLVLIYLSFVSTSFLPMSFLELPSTATHLRVLKPAVVATTQPAQKTVSSSIYRGRLLRRTDPIIPPQGSGGICGGSANGCWGNFSIETDPETIWPNTGRVVEYNLTIVNTTCAPDGISKTCLLFNNQFPGPTIEANWGDWVKITVNNQMQDNGTSIHWHGIRQKGTNDQDGVSGLTECPLVPGKSRTYMWQAMSYGTSWYHSHLSTQYGDGVVGLIVIHGPTSAGYDIDLGPIAISEIYRSGGAAALDTIITTQGPLKDVPENILFNGMNVNALGGGKRLQLTFEPEKRHLMRFVNIGVDNFYKIGLDGHIMQVVAVDFQPVKPYMAQYVSLGVGQRMDVIVTANRTIGNYWLRAIPMSCVENKYDGKGIQNPIISYRGAPASLPTTIAAPLEDDGCFDEPAEKTIPFVAKSVDISNFDPRHLPVASPFQVTSNKEGRVFRWSIGNTTQSVDLENPILQRLFQGNSTITPEDNIIGVDEKDTWAFWYLQNNFYEPHPIHMHGNDLRILSTGQAQWDEDITKLQTTNPMRRDTFMLPAGGHAILAFFTDNPGIWLLHCHIAWHFSEGLSTSLFVRKDDIVPNATVAGNIAEGCQAWDAYLQRTDGGVYPIQGSGV